MSEAASLADEAFNDDFCIECEGYAITSCLHVTNRSSNDDRTIIAGEEHASGSAGFRGTFMKAISCFVKTGRAPQKVEEVTDDNTYDVGQDERKSNRLLDPNCLCDETISQDADNGLSLDSHSRTRKDGMEEDTEKDIHLLKKTVRTVRFSTIKDNNNRDTSISTRMTDDWKETPNGNTIPAREPMFEEMNLIPIVDEHSAARYSSEVCPWNVKLLIALGVKPSSCNVTSLSEDREILCKKAMGYLLELTEDCQTKYELEFEGVLVEEMNTIFISLKKLIDATLQ